MLIYILFWCLRLIFFINLNFGGYNQHNINNIIIILFYSVHLKMNKTKFINVINNYNNQQLIKNNKKYLKIIINSCGSYAQKYCFVA